MQKEKMLDLEKSKSQLEFRPGDLVSVGFKLKEGDKTRVQAFKGVVLGRKGTGVSETFTVRKIGVAGIGIERIFPVHSPLVEYVKVEKEGKARRAKLYYLREKR